MIDGLLVGAGKLPDNVVAGKVALSRIYAYASANRARGEHLAQTLAVAAAHPNGMYFAALGVVGDVIATGIARVIRERADEPDRPGVDSGPRRLHHSAAEGKHMAGAIEGAIGIVLPASDAGVPGVRRAHQRRVAQSDAAARTFGRTIVEGDERGFDLAVGGEGQREAVDVRCHAVSAGHA